MNVNVVKPLITLLRTAPLCWTDNACCIATATPKGARASYRYILYFLVLRLLKPSITTAGAWALFTYLPGVAAVLLVLLRYGNDFTLERAEPNSFRHQLLRPDADTCLSDLAGPNRKLLRHRPLRSHWPNVSSHLPAKHWIRTQTLPESIPTTRHHGVRDRY